MTRRGTDKIPKEPAPAFTDPSRREFTLDQAPILATLL